MSEVRLIDANKLIRQLEICKANANPLDYNTKATYAECIAMAKAMEIIEVEPIKHGKWISNQLILNRITCSECKCYFDSLEIDLYCPNCGAKMVFGV